MSSISPISGSGGIQPINFPSLEGTGGTGAAQGSKNGGNFADSISNALDGLQQTQSKSDDLAMQMATGQLTDIQDYMIAANQAELATQLTVAVRNKAVDAF